MINELRLLGNLGGPPEIKTLPGGSKVAVFSIPLYHSYVKEGAKKEWIKVEAYGKLADIVEGANLQTGAQVITNGELYLTPFEGNDGSKRIAPSLKAEKVIWISKKGAGGNSQNTNQSANRDTNFSQRTNTQQTQNVSQQTQSDTQQYTAQVDLNNVDDTEDAMNDVVNFLESI